LVIFKVCSHDFQNVHELVYGVTLNKLFIALIAQEKEGAGADVNHDALDVFSGVVHGDEGASLDYLSIIGHLGGGVNCASRRTG